jgi:hypothetical protein
MRWLLVFPGSPFVGSPGSLPPHSGSDSSQSPPELLGSPPVVGSHESPQSPPPLLPPPPSPPQSSFACARPSDEPPSLTTSEPPPFSAAAVMELYRQRWQIELAIKRLKVLLGLGRLPKKDPPSARAWRHGKLFVSLLVERLVEAANAFSPWGYELGVTA